MSSDDSTNAPSTGDSASSEITSTGGTPTAAGRREAVREKAQQVQVRQSRARMVRSAAWITGAVVVVAAVAIVVGMTVGRAASKPQLSPDGTDHDGFVVTSISSAGSGAVTSPDDATPSAAAEATPTPSTTASTAAPVQIHVYVDYLSPSAREWQLANESNLSSWVAEGAATLTYHPVAMLTAKSNGTKYSLRAASAAACVATYAPASFFQFNSDLLKRQPAVDSDGFSDKDLADIASANGTGDEPKKLRECIETETYASWAKAATERAVAGIEGTDALSLTGNAMVLVNGQAYQGEMTDPAEFSQFVLTSASGKSAKNQTPTPTPTPSVTP
ncbi:thioredoxin domain-containing protein [Microbacterium sp. 2C]|uniref:DsbA family protein n=1 Tax=Microbacterium paulum TaxID=2707006 RepID=UPI0018C21183|nr:thioredoxin domain-containing protein [Microbacterium paulum]MBG0717486.1 thioredoxin domain-containing protein [Microbacterium paulum]